MPDGGHGAARDIVQQTVCRARGVMPLENLPDVGAVLETIAAPLAEQAETQSN